MNIITVCLAIILIVLLFYILITYNSFVSSKNKVKQAKSSIDVYLTQRFDLIPNLVSCVKGYMKHEKEVQEKVASLRKAYTEMKDLNVGAELNAICNKLIALVENYPDLKASENFLNLQNNLSKMENQLQAARRLYNSEVTLYNTKIEKFPGNIIAKIFKFKEAELFKADEEALKNISIEF